MNSEEIITAGYAFVRLLAQASDKDLDAAQSALARHASSSRFATATHEPLSGLCVAIQAEFKKRLLFERELESGEET